MKPDEIINEVKASALRGRGGAGPGGMPPPRVTSHLDLRLDGARLKLFQIQNDGTPAFTDLTIAGPYNISGPGNSPSR